MKETDKLSAASSDIKKGLGDASQAARAKQGELKEVDEGRVKLQQEIQGLEVKVEMVELEKRKILAEQKLLQAQADVEIKEKEGLEDALKAARVRLGKLEGAEVGCVKLQQEIKDLQAELEKMAKLQERCRDLENVEMEKNYIVAEHIVLKDQVIKDTKEKEELGEALKDARTRLMKLEEAEVGRVELQQEVAGLRAELKKMTGLQERCQELQAENQVLVKIMATQMVEQMIYTVIQRGQESDTENQECQGRSLPDYDHNSETEGDEGRTSCEAGGRLTVIRKEEEAGPVAAIKNKVVQPEEGFTPGAVGKGVEKKISLVQDVNQEQSIEKVIKKRSEQIRDVADITPFSKYTVKVKVERQGRIRRVNKSSFCGKVLECTLADTSSQVKMSAYSREGEGNVEQMQQQLREGCVYYVSGATVKPVRDDMFNKTGHFYELVWDQFTKVEGPLEGEEINLPYKLQALSKVDGSDVGCLLDVVAFVREVGPCTVVPSILKNKQFMMRKVLIEDSSGTAVLDLWDDTAMQFSVPCGKVLAVRRGQVQQHDGKKSLSIKFTGSIEVEPTSVSMVSELVSWEQKQQKKECELPSQRMLGENLLIVADSGKRQQNTTRGRKRERSPSDVGLQEVSLSISKLIKCVPW